MDENMKTTLNNTEWSVELAKISGLVEKAALVIKTETDVENGNYVFKVFVGTTGGLRKFGLSGETVAALTDWMTDISKSDTYVIFIGVKEEFEILKHSQISGIRVVTDEEFNDEVKKMENKEQGSYGIAQI